MTARPGTPPVLLPSSVTFPDWANGHRDRFPMELDFNDCPGFDDAPTTSRSPGAAPPCPGCGGEMDDGVPCSELPHSEAPTVPQRAPQGPYRTNARTPPKKAPPATWWRLFCRCVSDHFALRYSGRLPLSYYLEARRNGIGCPPRGFAAFGVRNRYYPRRAS